MTSHNHTIRKLDDGRFLIPITVTHGTWIDIYAALGDGNDVYPITIAGVELNATITLSGIVMTGFDETPEP